MALSFVAKYYSFQGKSQWLLGCSWLGVWTAARKVSLKVAAAFRSLVKLLIDYLAPSTVKTILLRYVISEFQGSSRMYRP